MAKKKTKKTRKVGSSRYKNSYESKDKGGSSRQGIFDFKKIGADNITFFKPKEKMNKIIIVPYEVTSKNHPLVRSGDMEIGDLDYIMDIWVHRYVGASTADIVCPKKNYSKPCPLCDKVNELWDEDEDTAKQLKASRRAYYNILEVNKGEVDDTIKIFDVSHFLFEKELIEEANDCSDGEDIVEFADLEDGKIIKFRHTIDDSGAYKTPKFKSFDFLEREEELDEGIVEEAISFDGALVVLSPEEILDLYNGEGDDDESEDDEEEKPTKSKKGKKSKKPIEPEEEEEEEEDDEEEEEDEPVKKPAKKSKSKPKKKKDPEPEEDDEEEEEEIPQLDLDDEDDEEEEEKPAKKSKAKKEKKPAKSKKGKCPFGHKFGVDCDETNDCDECDCWDDCMEASED